MGKISIWLLAFAYVFSSSQLSASVEVKAIEITVSDLPRALTFYTETLQFQRVGEWGETGRVNARLLLGEESLILRSYLTKGKPIPENLPSNDLSFEHLAIVVGDMDAAYRRLLQHDVKMVSASPQRLPDWNWDAARIRALYFRDPDGHFLELIQFPSDKGEPKWQRRSNALFRGIDHSAIVVSDMKRSRDFYLDVLGMSISGESLNYGQEQELLSGVAGSRVRITSLRGAKGPGIELLAYEKPGTVRSLPDPPALHDVSHWQIDLEIGDIVNEAEKIDPDGHAIAIERHLARRLSREYPLEALRQHWPRYLMEGAELGIFMVVALYLTLILEHPESLLHQAIASPVLRRSILGVGIGVTVTCLIYSTWGMQSGAQFNPGVTLSLLYLHRIQPWDAFYYIIAQFLGGCLGVVLAALPFWKASQHQDVNFVVTAPGPKGAMIAFVAEFVISFILMATLRLVHQQDLLKPFTGYFAGSLLFLYITFEVPLSGMSLNPARSVASAIPAANWKAMWVYFTAPPLAMLLAAKLCQ